MIKDKLEEEIISKALKCQGVIPDTRANIILCRKVIELTRKEDFEMFENMIEDLYRQHKQEVWGRCADEICDLIELSLKQKLKSEKEK